MGKEAKPGKNDLIKGLFYPGVNCNLCTSAIVKNTGKI